MNVIECPEFRALLVFLGQGTISDKDIPGRTALTAAIFKRHRLEEEALKQELLVCLLRISCDVCVR